MIREIFFFNFGVKVCFFSCLTHDIFYACTYFYLVIFLANSADVLRNFNIFLSLSQST